MSFKIGDMVRRCKDRQHEPWTYGDKVFTVLDGSNSVNLSLSDGIGSWNPTYFELDESVPNFNGGSVVVYPDHGPGEIILSDGRILKYTVEDPPWEPKVGDTVWYKTKSGAISSWDGVTFLMAHGDGEIIDTLTRKWAVVAYEGDIPRVILFNELLKERP